MKTGVLHGCKCIGLPTDIIKRLGDLKSGSLFSPLENQMFDEVRQTIFSKSFIPGPGIDPDTHSHRSDIRHLLGNNFDAVVQVGFACPGVVIHLPLRLCG